MVELKETRRWYYGEWLPLLVVVAVLYVVFGWWPKWAS